ncbi:MAG TPA: hypothetical protein VNL91_07615 [Thermoanaerobaculia bacterium]|nr:hypothetical protein [Thermoanaerobaculia bacterium]
MDKRLDILDLPDDLRALLGACELTGQRTRFDRNGKTTAVLLSWDEYLALRETLEIANDAPLRERLARAEDEARGQALLLPEDLFEVSS